MERFTLKGNAIPTFPGRSGQFLGAGDVMKKGEAEFARQRGCTSQGQGTGCEKHQKHESPELQEASWGGRERDEAGETGRGEMIEVFFAENWGEVHVKLTGTGVIAIGFTFWKSIFLRNCGGQWTPRLSRVRKEAVECRWAFLTLERASPGGLDKTQVLPQSFWVSRSGARSHNLYF